MPLRSAKEKLSPLGMETRLRSAMAKPLPWAKERQLRSAMGKPLPWAKERQLRSTMASAPRRATVQKTDFFSFSLSIFCGVSPESALGARKPFSAYQKTIRLVPVRSAPGCSPRSRWSTRSQIMSAVLFSSAGSFRSGRKLLQDCLIHSDAGVEVLQRKILVRRMGAAIRQRQSAQKCFSAENAPKIGHDRDAPAFANERDIFVESFA